MSADQILDALDPDQREVALALRGPVCVLAGAGTGKTRAITHRIAYGVRTGTYQPTSVLAVTFTARAAGELRTRLRGLGVVGVQARTFHAAALRQLSYFWPKVVGGAPPRILDHKAPVVAEAAQRLGLAVDRLAVRDLASEIEWAKVSLVPADDYVRAATATGRPAPAGFDHTAVARLVTAYEEAKTARGVVDFEDVLVMLGHMIESRVDVAEQVRSQYRTFVVDEYQDVSPAQQYLLEQWLGGRQELCVVGDPSQTIYSFTGATPYHLLRFPVAYPKAKVVRLVRDYRSTPQVVGLANRVLARAPRGPGQGAPLELVAQRPPGPQVRFATYEDDEGEARAVADRIGRLVADGLPAREIAVLFRTNAQSEVIEAALAEAGIGYVVRGGERFFARQDVRQALVLLRGAVRPMADLPAGEAARAVLSSVGWAPEPPAPRGAVRERWDAMVALVQVADDLAAANPETRLADVVADLDERRAAQHAPEVDGVTLASLHAAKGLEWDAVFLVGLSDGLLPISLAETRVAQDEERRLLYVGVTRARERLELSWARSRTRGSRGNRKRSRFLEGIWGGAADPAGGADPALLDALTAWRDATASAEGVTPAAVLADGVVAAVARARPGSIEDLARVRGFGPTKLARYGAEVTRIAVGRGAGELAEKSPG